MEYELIQRTRYMLESRVRRVRVCSRPNLAGACRILWSWMHSTTIIRGIIAPLEIRADEIWEEIRDVGAKLQKREQFEAVSLATEIDLAAAGLAALRRLSDSASRPDDSRETLQLNYLLFEEPQRIYSAKSEDLLAAFRDHALDAISQYIDENLDTRNVILGILRRYKVRCERFRKQRLRAIASAGLEKLDGERALAVDLYEYLHDQGIEFLAEPKTGAGEPDLIAHRSAARELLADAKYLRHDDTPSKIKTVLFDGLRQVLDYCKEESRAIGYLIVFSEADRILEFKAMHIDDVFPCVRIDGTTIYYLMIDIADIRSASKRGRAEKIVIDVAEAITTAIDSTKPSTLEEEHDV